MAHWLAPLATLLGIAFLTNAAWLGWRTDESRAHYYIAIFNTTLLFGLRLIFAKQPPREKWAEPIIFLISLLVIVYALAEARMDKTPWSTTQIIMTLIVGGFVFSSRNWLSALLAIACAGWFWAAFPHLSNEAWVHLGASLLVAVVWSVWFLEIRLRTGRVSVAPVESPAPAGQAAPAPISGIKDDITETELLRARDDTMLFKDRATAAARRSHLLLRRLSDLAAMSPKPNDPRNVGEILSTAAAAAHRWTPVGIGAFVLLRDQQTGRFSLGGASGKGRFKTESLSSEHVLVAAALIDRVPLIVPAVGQDIYKIRDLFEGDRVEAFAALPLWSPDGLLGLLVVLDGGAREFPQPEQEFLTALAHQCASSIILLRLQNAKRSA